MLFRSEDALTPTPTAKNAVDDAPDAPDTSDADPDPAAATATPTIPFVCPPAFATAASVQLDDGVYVTCAELKPFYGYVDAVSNDFT